MTLAELRIGQTGRIGKVRTIGPLKRRLMDMGIVSGTDVTVEKVAPMGDPIEVCLKNYRLSLRREEAEKIEVDEVR
ncbi:MAG: ferrous iron transport protein A [Deltaproteobacteria bacterium]|nr:ferrous iron transport protein A [Deltaproteobacteria bacterium]